MVTNIDDNVGRLLRKLDELKIAQNTIVIFLSDNGPEQKRYNGGLRGLKGTVYEGGLRVPFFFRWPAGLQEARKVDAPFAHIDVVPTLLEATEIPPPAGVKLDGTSFLPWLRGEKTPPDRTLFFQWHRGDVPQRFRSCTARSTRWKLVFSAPTAKPQLFDLEKNRGEEEDLADAHPDIVERLTKEYSDWFSDMERTRGFAPPRIILGTEHEDPAILTRQNARGEAATAAWLVTVAQETRFDVTLRFRATGAKTRVTYQGGAKPVEIEVDAGATSVLLPAVPHAAGDTQIGATIAAAKPYSPDYVELKRVP
jgi:arylsulfatase/arylsulfatase A